MNNATKIIRKKNKNGKDARFPLIKTTAMEIKTPIKKIPTNDITLKVNACQGSMSKWAISKYPFIFSSSFLETLSFITLPRVLHKRSYPERMGVLSCLNVWYSLLYPSLERFPSVLIWLSILLEYFFRMSSTLSFFSKLKSITSKGKGKTSW